MSAKQQNPLLDDLDNLPHITITLPSKGLFYDEDMFVEGTDPTELEVHPFTMWEEVHHSNPFAIMSGKATRKMVNTVAPEIKNPDGLCSYDVDILMLAGRMASYGDKMKITLTCGNPDHVREVEENGQKKKVKCESKTDMDVNIRELINGYPMIENTDDWNVELPNGQKVTFRPTLYNDMLSAMKIGVSQEKINQIIRTMKDLPEEKIFELSDQSVDNLMNVKLVTTVSSIKSVITSDGSKTIKDRDMIVQWLSRLNADYIDIIQDKLDELSAPFENTGRVSYVCPECGYENKGINLVQDQSRFFTRG